MIGRHRLHYMLKKLMFHTHSQYPATERQTNNLFIPNDRSANQTMVAKAIFHIRHKNMDVSVAKKVFEFRDTKFYSSRIELSCTLKELNDSRQIIASVLSVRNVFQPLMR